MCVPERNIRYKEGISHTNEEISVGKIKARLIEIKRKTDDIFITFLYRSHSIAIPNFIKDLNLHIESCQNLKNHIIVGDINIDILKLNENSNDYVKNYLNLGFRPFINIPTRVTANSSSCIDHIFGKLPGNASISLMTCDLDVTDHYATMILADTDIDMQKIKTNKLKKLNYIKLKELASTIDCTSIYEVQDIDEIVQIFITKIQNIINKSTKLIQCKKKNKPRKTWITKDIMESCNTKNNLYKYVK